MKALYIGSFDPFTNGHYEILKQAENIFDKVLLVIADNTNKQRYFDHYITLRCIDAIKGKNTQVALSPDLAPDLFKYEKCDYIIRGLRNTTDYLYEEQLFDMYKQINPDVKVMYLRAESKASSTLVRELYKRKLNVKNFVPYDPELLVSHTEKFLKELHDKKDIK